MPDDPHPTTWLDVKIPLWGLIGLGIALIGQTATLLMWGVRMDERVQAVEAKVGTVLSISETVARMDERTRAMVQTVERIERRVDAQAAP